MWCRLENITETEINITYNLQNPLNTFCKVLKRCKPEWIVHFHFRFTTHCGDITDSIASILIKL